MKGIWPLPPTPKTQAGGPAIPPQRSPQPTVLKSHKGTLPFSKAPVSKEIGPTTPPRPVALSKHRGASSSQPFHHRVWFCLLPSLFPWLVITKPSSHHSTSLPHARALRSGKGMDKRALDPAEVEARGKTETWLRELTCLLTNLGACRGPLTYLLEHG